MQVNEGRAGYFCSPLKSELVRCLRMTHVRCSA